MVSEPSSKSPPPQDVEGLIEEIEATISQTLVGRPYPNQDLWRRAAQALSALKAERDGAIKAMEAREQLSALTGRDMHVSAGLAKRVSALTARVKDLEGGLRLDVERIAQWLHDEYDPLDRPEHGARWTWPEWDGDDGKRGDGRLTITPKGAQEQYRHAAERLSRLLHSASGGVGGGEP